MSQAEVDQGARVGTTTSDAQRLVELEKEDRELRRANAILRTRLGFLRSGVRSPLSLIVDFIEAHKAEHGVEPICKALNSTA